MEKLDNYEGITIPEGVNVYTVKNKESVHYKQMFTFDEEGDLRLIKPHELLKEIKKTKDLERDIEEIDLEGEKIRAVNEFREFLKQEYDMTYSEYHNMPKDDKRAYKKAFQTWLRKKRGKDVDWDKRLKEFKSNK